LLDPLTNHPLVILMRLPFVSTLSNRLLRFLAPILPLAALGSGCTPRVQGALSNVAPDASNRYETSAIEASFRAASDGTHLRLTATLLHGGPLHLDGGDRLEATIDGRTVALAPEWDGVATRYVAVVTPPAGPAEVAFAFLRPPGRASATATRIHLPAPFRIVKSPSAILARATKTPALVLGGDPSLRRVRLVFHGACLGHRGDVDPALSAEVDPRGAVTFDPTAIGGSGTCPVAVTVQAETETTPDSAFAPPDLLNESRVEAAQIQSFSAVYSA
jgi:hypothetical protein